MKAKPRAHHPWRSALPEPTPAQIRAVRRDVGLTQAEAAKAAYLGAYPRWSEWEAGRRPPDPSRWEMFLLRVNRHPHFELVPRRIPLPPMADPVAKDSK